MSGTRLAVSAALERMKPRARESVRFDALSLCHDGGQRQMVGDPSRFRLWQCGRRFGKTQGAGYLLYDVALGMSQVRTYYVSTSIKRAAETLWDDLRHLNRDHRLGGTTNETTHTVTLPNGSRVQATGVEHKRMADDLRGRKRVALYIIDECQDWPDELLRYFYEQVVFPSLADVRGGVVIAGTGGAPRGWWYTQTQDEQWSRHRRTIRENPTLPTGEAEALIAKACKDRGCDERDPSIRREFFAEFVADTQRQVFQLERGRNGYTALPKGDWCYVIGFDPGTVDKAAVSVWGWSSLSPKLYLVAYQALAGMPATEQIAMVTRMAERYPPVAIVADPATGGAAFILDLQDRFGAPVEAAEKQGKVSAILLLRDAFRRGEVLIPDGEWPAGEFLRALETPEWDPDKVAQSLKGHMPDLVDAALYAFRKARQFEYAEALPPETEEERVMRRLHEQRAAERAAVRELVGE